jgi:hypothetical protein
LAIHAGKGLQYLGKEEINRYPTGCVIAIANLKACVVRESLQRNWLDERFQDQLISGCKVTWKQAFEHAYTEGPYCWILSDVHMIKPVEIRGRQGLWNWEPLYSEIVHARPNNQ